MQYVAEDNSDKIRLCAVPWLDVVSVSAVEILLVSDGEVDLTRRASGQQEQGCEVTWEWRQRRISNQMSHLRWVFASRWWAESERGQSIACQWPCTRIHWRNRSLFSPWCPSQSCWGRQGWATSLGKSFRYFREHNRWLIPFWHLVTWLITW